MQPPNLIDHGISRNPPRPPRPLPPQPHNPKLRPGLHRLALRPRLPRPRPAPPQTDLRHRPQRLAARGPRQVRRRRGAGGQDHRDAAGHDAAERVRAGERDRELHPVRRGHGVRDGGGRRGRAGEPGGPALHAGAGGVRGGICVRGPAGVERAEERGVVGGQWELFVDAVSGGGEAECALMRGGLSWADRPVGYGIRLGKAYRLTRRRDQELSEAAVGVLDGLIRRCERFGETETTLLLLLRRLHRSNACSPRMHPIVLL